MRMTAQERGLYRLRTASDAHFSPAAYGYGRRPSAVDKLALAIFATIRVTIAIAVLFAWLAAIFLYRDTQIELFGIGGGWLTLAHLLVPLGFFLIALTNRRYGPGYALAQLVGTGIALAVLLALKGDELYAFLPLDQVPSVREASAFGAAFFLANLVSITAFEGARGPMWWTAPLIGFLSAALVFPLVFFPAFYLGSSADWLSHCLAYLLLLLSMSLLLLIPFCALRRLVPPIAGFGGY